MIVDHIFHGPAALYPPGSRSPHVQWLWSFLSLEKGRPFKGPVERRQLFELPNIWKGTEGYKTSDYIYPVVRRIVWDRDRDRERARKGPVSWPTMASDLYELPARRFDSLNRLMLQLDEALPSFPFDATGINKDMRPPPDVSAMPKAKAIDYSLSLKRGTQDTSLEVACSSLSSEQFTEAFIALWDFLGSFCVPKRLADPGWQERWDVSPRKYAAALKMAMARRSRN